MARTIEGKMYISTLKHKIGMERDSAWSVPYLDGLEYGIRRRKDLTDGEKKAYYEIIKERRLKMISR